ncbi:uncharacterized protein LOC128220731 [Mya arenaria]|uniref:uncharacterized protein LOC128220731 n=1 Tax=Mya arenaria TaxID=6604 RepID=UPI0022E05316|nr:uncharacterized protein LOC128220731 [Mya arenaria]
MVTKYFTLLLESCLTLLVSSTVLKKYQEYPLQLCPMNAVCSKIYGLPSHSIEPAFVSYLNCKCPSGAMCAVKPGPQTLEVDPNKWYGLCQPAVEIPECASGEVAEVAETMAGQTFTKVQCKCPRQALEETTSTNFWSDIMSRTRDISSLICNLDGMDDSLMSKRGRFGGRGYGRSRGKFYFYRK